MTIDAALTPEPIPHLGVIIVSFNSGDVLPSCLESLLAATGVALSIVIVDNASSDDTLGRIEAWAAGEDGGVPPSDSVVPFPKAARPIALDGSPHASGHDVRLIRGPRNLGYAGGVNEGLRALLPLDALDRFWILNPDSVIPDGTARAFAMHPGGFSLLGGRVLYHDNSNAIQIDGGTIRWLTGTTHNVNQFKNAARSPMPTGEDLDFITGASMVASRAFVEQVGMMEESYFLYYEEVDWALRRGAMPLACVPEAVVYHRAGTAIGSPAPGRPASVFSLYFKNRARMKFLAKYRPLMVGTGFAFSIAKAAQLLLKGFPREAIVVLTASFGAAPPYEVTARLSPEVIEMLAGRAEQGG